MFRLLIMGCLLITSPALAAVSITTQGDQRVIATDGLPDHTTGRFPNSGNPHSIIAHTKTYRMPLNPEKAGRITPMRGQPFGVALNGVVFDPGTAECYGQPRGGRPGASCDWREEAIVNGKGQLGLDHNHAHVQPSGAYHYHGIPTGLVTGQTGAGNDIVHVGYAADGFKMVVSRSNAFQPSYRLKTGTRPSGPGGRYNGKYTQDYTFINGAGDLDACNGMMYEGDYVYVVTQDFPFIPRCWVGTPDSSFSRMMGGNRGERDSRRPRPDRPHPPHYHRY